jgi:hypothetical protein
VFFTDVGRNRRRSPHERVTTNAYSSGCLMKYNPKTSRVTVL